MSKTLTLKCFFPRNQYLLRKVKIKSGNGKEYSIGYLETIQITDAESYLEFKLDYHKYRLSIDSITDDAFIIVYLKYRNKFPFYYIDIMFNNAMFAEVVDENRFMNFDRNYLQHVDINPFKYTPIKIGLIVSAYLLFLSFLGISLFALPNESTDRNFLFIYGLAGVVSISRVVVYRNKISERGFWYRMILFTVLSMAIILLTSIDDYIKLINVGILLLMLSMLMYDNPLVKKTE
jgi:hypothetical protein